MTSSTAKRPKVSIIESPGADRCIKISNMPPRSLVELNGCTLERILNHIKGAYIKGDYEDLDIKHLYNRQRFRFCMSYTFAHDKNNNLFIKFFISHTDTAPTWINDTESDHSLSYMTKNEASLMADAFTHQCACALQNYLSLIHEASADDTEPNYYDTNWLSYP